MNLAKTANVTGHRPGKLYGYDLRSQQYKKLAVTLIQVFEHLIEEEGIDTVITGMALGVDQLTALVLYQMRQTKYPHLKIVAAVPCKNQHRKWRKESKDLWEKIISFCDEVHYVSEEEYTPWCMEERNKWMVNRSLYTVGVHDGTSGGTANCLRYARKQNRNITLIDPKTYKIYYQFLRKIDG